jgi:hypothetical protein
MSAITERPCERCGEPLGYNARFCSQSCRSLTVSAEMWQTRPRAATEERPCSVCGEPFTVVAHKTVKTCSPKCAVDSRRGVLNCNYNGGLCRRSDGRLIVVCRDGSLMLFNRAVMSAELGRLLRDDEIVHHRNGDCTDDRAENLQVTTRAEHIGIHRADLVEGKRAAYAERMAA